MRKLGLVITLSVMAFLSVLSIQKSTTYAENINQDISSTITISQDATITNTDFIIKGDCSKDMVFEVESGTLTIDGCNFTAESTDVLDCIFKVNSGANLILKNTSFSNINYSKCIANRGVVEIDNVTFVTGRYSIENNGASNSDSIRYYSGNLENVTLSSGYISVFENTKVDKEIKVKISNFNNLTLAVRGVGENVFASKYIDKFIYRDSNIGADDNYYFDYIGDFDTTTNDIKDASGMVSLKPGDIVLTTGDLTVDNDDTIFYAPQYCTSYNYFKSEFEKFEEGSYQIKLYRSGALGRTLDNYSANMSQAVFREISDTVDFVTLKINRIVRGDTDLNVGSSEEVYIAGSNHAIFVDIPEGYEIDGVEFASASEMFGILDNELYANNCYLRPIIEYKASNYTSKNVTVNFIFREKVAYANVELAPNTNITLNTPSEMVVGSEYTFTLTCAENEIISAIKFNGDAIDFDYDSENKVYSFTMSVLESNTISVETKTVLDITPNPEKTEFEYGDIVELKENYKVSDNESIVIEYEATEKVARGTYAITEVKSCSSDKYVINIVGNKSYSIVKKKVNVSSVATKSYTTQYSENMALEITDFLVNELPEYLTAELDNISSFVGGEQTVRMFFSLTNANYIIEGNDYIDVVLIVTPKELSTTEIEFVGATKEYIGSKLEILATNYDDSKITVNYTYYLASDLSTPIVEAINVGEYVVKAVYTSKSSLYSVNGEKSATLTITPKAIDMSNYLQSIEVTEFVYDGTNKSLDLKANTLPNGVVISNPEIAEETKKDANIYYFNVLFDTTSNNYTCVSEKQVALVIKARLVTIALENAVFSYTGKAPNLVVEFTNVIDGDIVTPIFESAIATTVGTHTVRVLRLSNTNYALASYVDLEYKIESISVDMSGVAFNNIETTYDGQSHRPELTGVLPLEISYVIDTTQACINAGTYNVKCTFSSSDEGIVVPQPMYATVIIHKRELTAVFSEPSNMIANGQKKSLTVDLDGVVAGEEVDYSLEYSNEPILAGEYTCRINLVDAPNYTLKSNAPYRFIIFMSTINYSEAGLNMSVSGKFSSRENLTVSRINDNLTVVNLLAKMDIKNYVALNLSCVSFSSELMTVSVDTKNIADKTNYLKAYRIKDNQLEEIEYTIKDNVISFQSNCNEKIVFVESYDYIYTHRLEINAIIIFAIISMTIIIVLEIVNVKSKRSKGSKQVK